ncbi:transient receptor potential cation channel subfamily M member 3 [Trichonephila clavipes]|nr:transient receptor potential cation channel subfamily M member 3 [Trichonephila clavipes]
MKMRVRYRSRQNDRLRGMLVQLHIDITTLHTPLPVFRRIDFDFENEGDNKNLINLSSPDTIPKEEKPAIQRTWKSVMWNPSSFRRYVIHHPPLWKMVYLMWSAPITKFWTFQIFYIIYLAFFSIAVLWPSCGNYMLDLIVCCWTSLLALESVHPAVRMRKEGYIRHNLSNEERPRLSRCPLTSYTCLPAPEISTIRLRATSSSSRHLDRNYGTIRKEWQKSMNYGRKERQENSS